MGEEEKKGFRTILKLNLPPEKQFHSGHSLIVQGDTVQEVKLLLAEQVGEERAGFILQQFFENLLLGALQDALGVDPPATGTASGSTPAPEDAGGSGTSTAGATDTSKGSSADLSPMEKAKQLAKKKKGA